jgi:hypothetical protein
MFLRNPGVNLLAGVVGGGHLLLSCLALAMLTLSPGPGGLFVGHALALTLAPAVFGSLLLALRGRFPVALAGPDPSATLCVFLLLAAVSSDLSGRVPPAVWPHMFCRPACRRICFRCAGGAAFASAVR